MAKIKPEEESKLQVPGQKKSKLGLAIPAIKMPHDRLVEGLFVAEPSKEKDGADLETLPTPPNATHVTQPTPPNPDHPTHATQRIPAPRTPPTLANESPAAPMRDFHKMDNSVTRAIPDYFKNGKLKLIYDVLYQRSRGAFPASHTVQIARSEIMRLAGIGSMNTIDKAMKRLSAMGLVTQTFLLGDRSGNVYEVKTPAEIGYRGDVTHATQPTPPNATYPTPLTSAQELGDVRGAESALSGDSPKPINTGVSQEPKTLFKDFSYDDEQKLRETLDRFVTMAREATGREVTPADIDSLCEILHLVLDETELAATRASTITYFGKFAAENLRRRLHSKGKSAAKVAFFDPGRPDPVMDEDAVQVVEHTPEALDEAGKQKALEVLQEILENMGLEYTEKIYRPIYTEADWVWLMENLNVDES